MFSINILAVVLAAIANFVIGFLFHGPLFGKVWMKLANIHPTGNEKLSDMVPQMVKNFLSNLLFAGVLAVFYNLAITSSVLPVTPGISAGLLVGFLVWLGFILTSSSIEVIWMGRTAKLWCFELASSFVCILTMGAIISLM